MLSVVLSQTLHMQMNASENVPMKLVGVVSADRDPAEGGGRPGWNVPDMKFEAAKGVAPPPKGVSSSRSTSFT